MNIVITGASGFIGGAAFNSVKELSPIGTSFNSKTGDSRFFNADLRDEEQVKRLFDLKTPDLLFHFAALTSPQRNQDNAKLATESNLTVTQNIVRNLPPTSHIVFLSTDKVFDGTLDLPNEEDETSPQWIYGKLKFECEKLIQEQLSRCHIIRLPIVHSTGNKESGAFIDKALIDLKQGRQVKIFDNVKRCYVKLNELIDFLNLLISNENYGVYHVGSRMMTYYERVKALCEDDGIEWKEALIPTQGKVVPLTQNLDTRKAKNVFNYTFS